MISLVVRALDAYIERDPLKSRLRANRVPLRPWDSTAMLRRRLECAMAYGYPHENADPRWLASVEGHMMMAEARLMRALGVSRNGGLG